MKWFWALAYAVAASVCASAQTSSLSFNQIATSFTNTPPLALGGGAESPTACGVFGDFNGDGYTDYASFGAPGSSGSTLLRGYLGGSAGIITGIRSTLLPSFTCGVTQPFAADVNGDGKQDLVVLSTNAILVLLSDGDGTFAQPLSTAYTPVETTFASGIAPSTLGNAVVADFNGDKIVDLVVSDNAGEVLFYAGKGDGSFGAPVVLLASAVSSGLPYENKLFGSLITADINRDGIADFVVCYPEPEDAFCQPAVFLGSTAGPQQQTTQIYGDPIAVADLNGDSKPDMLLLPTNGNGLEFAAGNGDGTFQAPVNAGVNGDQLPVLGYCFLVDINRDGTPDLVFEQPFSTRTPAWAQGNGNGTFGTPQTVETGTLSVLAQAVELAPGLPAILDTAGVLYEPTTSSNPSVLSAWLLDFGAAATGVQTPAQTLVAALNGNFAVSSITATPPVSATGCVYDAKFLTCSTSVSVTPSSASPYVGAVTITGNGTPAQIVVPVFANELAPAAVTGLRLAPSPLSFGNQPLLTASSAQVLTLTNTGVVTEQLASTVINGNQASDFTLDPTSNCGSSLTAGASCTLAIVFTPQLASSATGQITVTDSAGLSASAALTGTGIYVPSFTANPAQLQFGSVRVGSTSAAQNIVLTNTSQQFATLTSNVVLANGGSSSAAYSVNTVGCSSAVAVGSTCTITVTYTPSAAETDNATLVLTDQNQKTTSVGLSGTGVLSNPDAVVSPNSLSFGQQALGTTSAAQPVTISNTGQQTLTISFVGISGQFAQTGSCTSVVAGSSCVIQVTYTPSALGAVTGALSVEDNSGAGTQTVTLSGTGIPIPTPQIVVEPTLLTFANQAVSTTSAAQVVTVTNTGSATANLGTITTTGAFPAVSSCGSTLAPNASCAVGVTFAPTSAGSLTGTLTVSDNAAGSPQTIPLGGVGFVTPVPVIQASPATLTFQAQIVGTVSSSQTVTVTNSGTLLSNLASVTVTGPFTVTNGCGSTVAASSSCSLTVVFTPTAAGTATGLLTISDDASGSPQTIALAGTGALAPSAQLVLSPIGGLTFPSQNSGSLSAAQTVTVTNTGNQTASVVSVSVTGPFQVSAPSTSGCGSTITPGTSCVLSVVFAPTSAGTAMGTLTLTDDASNSPQTIPLSGTGAAAPQSAITVSPSTLPFPSQLVGSVSAPLSVTVANTGNATADLGSVSVTGPFAVVNGCGSSLAASASCTLSLTFAPTAAGASTGQLSIASSGPSSSQTVSLTGTGTDASTASVSTNPNSSTTQTATSTTPATYALTLTPPSGLTGSLTYAVNCTGAPTGYQCTPSQSSVTLSNQTQANVTFTVQSTQTSGSLSGQEATGTNGGAALLAFPLLGWLGSRRRRAAWNAFANRRDRTGSDRRLTWLLGVGSSVAVVLLAGCSGGGSNANSFATTAHQTYTLTANFVPSSGVTISEPLTLIVNTTVQ